MTDNTMTKNKKKTNNDEQSTKQKTGDRATLSPLMSHERIDSSCSTSGTRGVTPDTIPVVSHE
jgi:hypothetical protein